MNTGLGLGGGQQLGGGLNLGGGLKLGQGLQLGIGQQQATSASTIGQQTAGLGLGTSGGLQLGGGGLQLGGGGLQLGTGGLKLGTGMQAKTTGTTGIGLGMGTGLGTQQQTLGLTGGLGTSGVGIGLNLGGIGGTGSQQQASKPGLTLGTGLNLGGSSGLGTSSGLSNTGTQQGIFSGQQQPQHQQQQQLNSITQMANALVMPLVFGDNRDLTIKKFNQVQAYCGQGKGIVNHTQSIDFSQDNPYCRFKAVCYSCLPKYKDEDGLVALYIDKPDKEVSQTRDSVLTSLQSVIANSNVTVVIEGIRALPDNSTELTIYVTEKSIVGGSHRLSARNLFVYLQANQVSSVSGELGGCAPSSSP